MTIVALIPINTTSRHLMEMHGVSAFSSAIIGFPGLPFDLPFAFLGGPLGASLGVGVLTAAATESLAGDAFAGTAGVFAFGLSPFF